MTVSVYVCVRVARVAGEQMDLGWILRALSVRVREHRECTLSPLRALSHTLSLSVLSDSCVTPPRAPASRTAARRAGVALPLDHEVEHPSHLVYRSSHLVELLLQLAKRAPPASFSTGLGLEQRR